MICTTPMWRIYSLMCHLDTLQNRALRIATGQLVSTPLKALQLEAKVPSYTTTSSRKILRSREKALLSAGDHPKRIAFDHEVQQRIQSRSSWRRKANQLAEAMPDALQHRQNINHFTIASWRTDISRTCTIYNHVPGINTRNDDTATRTICSLQQINSH